MHFYHEIRTAFRVNTDIFLTFILLLFEAILTSSNIMLFPYVYILHVPFQMIWRKFLPEQWFSRISAFVCESGILCARNQSNKIYMRLYNIGWARMRVFMSLNLQIFHFAVFSIHILLNKCLFRSVSLSPALPRMDLVHILNDGPFDLFSSTPLFAKKKIFDFCTHRLNQRVKHWTIEHASAWVCAIYVILVVICTFACLNIQIGFTIHVFYFWLSPHLKTKPKNNHR